VGEAATQDKSQLRVLADLGEGGVYMAKKRVNRLQKNWSRELQDGGHVGLGDFLPPPILTGLGKSQ